MRNTETKCSICFDVPTGAIASIPCQHIFCHGCLLLWIKKVPSCPLCQINLKKYKKQHKKEVIIVIDENHFVNDIKTPIYIE